MNITFRQLRVFTEVARHNSVQRASEVLHLTPQAVSMQLREIESQVGLRLFDRQGRGLSLSMAGEQFLMQARRMLALLKETQDLMARYKQVESTTCAARTRGCSPTARTGTRRRPCSSGIAWI